MYAYVTQWPTSWLIKVYTYDTCSRTSSSCILNYKPRVICISMLNGVFPLHTKTRNYHLKSIPKCYATCQNVKLMIWPFDHFVVSHAFRGCVSFYPLPSPSFTRNPPTQHETQEEGSSFNLEETKRVLYKVSGYIGWKGESLNELVTKLSHYWLKEYLRMIWSWRY